MRRELLVFLCLGSVNAAVVGKRGTSLGSTKPQPSPRYTPGQHAESTTSPSGGLLGLRASSSGNKKDAKDATFVKALSAKVLAEWKLRNTELLEKAKRTGDDFDDFVQAQTESANACSSRLLEAKQGLDALLHQVLGLQKTMREHEETLETTSKVINATNLALHKLKVTFKSETTACSKTTSTAMKEYQQYSKELKELVQMARPSVRFRMGLGMMATAKKVFLSDARSGEISQGWKSSRHPATPQGHKAGEVWKNSECTAFVAWAMGRRGGATEKHSHALKNLRNHGAGERKPDCRRQRAELQLVYLKAVKEIQDLRDKAKLRQTDVTCTRSAQINFNSESMTLVTKRQEHASLQVTATHALAALNPTLDNLRSKADRMKKYIKRQLTPECKNADKATEHLVAVRELILSLDKCPGKDQVDLKIPGKGPN